MQLTYLDSEDKPLIELTQWDVNRKIKIEGLKFDIAPAIHFYNDLQARALVVSSQLQGSNLIVKVPNILLQNDRPITLAIFVTSPNGKEGLEGKTTYMESIPVRTKLKPNDYEYKENIDYVDWVALSEEAKKQLAEMQAIIDDVNSKLQSGEFDGNGIKSITKIKTEGLVDTYKIEFTKGQPFEYNVKNGYTPVKGKDYFTEQEKAEMVEETKTKVVTIVEKDSANSIDLSIDSNYLMTANLKNKQGQVISTATIDFPIESMVVNASYSNGKLTLTLQNGNNLEVDISAIVSGLVNETTFNAKVKELNQQIANANQEIDQLTGEVSDIKLQQGTFKQEQTLQNANIGKNTNDIHTLINAISTISPAYDKETAKAEEITITDGTENPAKIEIYGNTKQATTKGNQLFACNGDSKSVNGVTMTNDNGLFTITGKATKTLSIELTLFDSFQKANLEGGQEYTQQVFDISGKRNFNIITAIQKVSGEVLYNYFISSPEFPTITKNIEANSIGYTNTAYIAEGQEVNCSFKVMLTKGKEKAIWEEYTGGQASPNPEFPQEIESVKGYNLLNVPEKFSVTNYRTIPIKLPAGTYYMNLDSKTIERATLMQPAYIDSSFESFFLNEGKNKIVFKKEVKELWILSNADYPSSKNTTTIFTKMMLVKEGYENKPYQPYGEIAVKQTGKNLCNSNKFILGKIWDNENIVNFSTGAYQIIPIDSNKQFNLSFKNNFNKAIRCYCFLLDKDMKRIDYIYWGSNIEANREYSETYKKMDKKLKYIALSFADIDNISIEKLLSLNIIINYGDKLSYEPYKETIYPVKLGENEMNKIGNAQDYFHRINGKWNLHKEIEKYEVTGEETFNYFQTNDKYSRTKTPINAFTPKGNDNYSNGISNYFVKTYFNDLALLNGNKICAWNNNGEKRIDFSLKKSYLKSNDTEGFIQFFKEKKASGNPVIVWYELETPEEIEILDTTLISQLDNLEKAQMFKGTNILTNNSIAEMKLNYKADTKIYLDGLFPKPEKQITE